MGVKPVIAVTDGDWFETRRRQPGLGEVKAFAPNLKGLHIAKAVPPHTGS